MYTVIHLMDSFKKTKLEKKKPLVYERGHVEFDLFAPNEADIWKKLSGSFFSYHIALYLTAHIFSFHLYKQVLPHFP